MELEQTTEESHWWINALVLELLLTSVPTRHDHEEVPSLIFCKKNQKYFSFIHGLHLFFILTCYIPTHVRP